MNLESRREMPTSVDDGDEDTNLALAKPTPVTTPKEDEYLKKLKDLDDTHGGI